VAASTLCAIYAGAAIFEGVEAANWEIVGRQDFFVKIIWAPKIILHAGAMKG
jgi:hypothetical protein